MAWNMGSYHKVIRHFQRKPLNFSDTNTLQLFDGIAIRRELRHVFRLSEQDLHQGELVRIKAYIPG